MADTTASGPSLRRWETQAWWLRLLVGRHPLRTMVRALLITAVILILAKWIFIPVRVTGRSMEPTFLDGRLSVMNRLAYRNADPARGDVVGIQLQGRRMILMKRILGLPGESVQVIEGSVFIKGKPLDEPYARGHDIPSMADQIVLGPGRYFVIGDNRDVTEYGVVERSEIMGKVSF